MHMHRDAVLEGARPGEIRALEMLCQKPDAAIPIHIAHRLRAKGWIDTVVDVHLVTIAGRTLVDLN